MNYITYEKTFNLLNATDSLNFPAVGDDGDSQTKKMYIFWMFLLHRSPYDF